MNETIEILSRKRRKRNQLTGHIEIKIKMNLKGILPSKGSQSEKATMIPFVSPS